MKASAFTFNQPETIYLVGKQISWTSDEHIFDGNALDSGTFYQINLSTPDVGIYAGGASGVATNSNFALGPYAIATVVINGASSSVQINRTTATTGNPGAANMGGFSLGADGNNLRFANFQAKEVILRSVADSAATRLAIQTALARKHGITL